MAAEDSRVRLLAEPGQLHALQYAEGPRLQRGLNTRVVMYLMQNIEKYTLKTFSCVFFFRLCQTSQDFPCPLHCAKT